ncbi:protein-tyrosine sulfotransferase-like isoform X2 [Magnolia sinica]|uniref:protein-tyrosine sulfotransferase-like isoform X2 n=1 Tax=Magnolia sinica TaxID=86752 RepID=UPI002657BB55|nr:protein-tyrosine sulfotransferase-like isoform X2 [Magnolia sinica]
MERRMASIYRFNMLVILLAMASASMIVVSAKDDFVQCESTVKNWATSSFNYRVKGDKLTLRDLLFFLHVPRTGGRTYYHCFLKKLYTKDQECPSSYDKLRFDPSKPNCRLMATHDDYSMMSKLPKERTSVVTILRNPVDRVFSTYEFSVEVAARFLFIPNLTAATRMEAQPPSKSHGTNTLDIWPWKYLVPWMRADLFVRRDAREIANILEIKETGDPYNMEHMVMPLHKFINEPLAHDIVHNGATFQVAGLTNNSRLAESHEVRHCVRKHPSLGQYVLDVAKNRLDDMLYVGLTEDHKESATMFVNMVGVQVLSLLEALSSRIGQAANNRTELNSSSGPDSSSQLQMTVVKLMEAYEVCSSGFRKTLSTRRNISFKRISIVNFSDEARLQVPETVLQQILLLNSLDVELYKHAQDIFAQQQKHLAEKLVKVEIQEMWRDSFGDSPWKVLPLTIAAFLFLALIFFILSSRRTSKLKV